ncbi:hypothetical protein BCR33DRAFT_159041 [Rhizoclosmatium globosum]|uniref:Uncharacterized protein n=1 Tax=Rhizoclosmatium globosum TaxID=329046 RepID=A0A1Y2CG96_9FUNG|nr:hypothetical protein BCR33DRAFT_159041 [Rhizoclosmatium globosum]|eukprot:ORY46032.1 hypothetical protein BCR33DRAFT_159041 [Rhizoclosmatium globosum]
MSRELETLLSGTTPLEHALGWLQAAAASPSDHAIRQLHSALPRLCTRLFGKASSNERGLVATPGPATDRLVAAIAAPTGPLMTLLLRADPLLRYHVESEALPLPTQKLLAQGADASALLPSLYFDRVAVTALPASNSAQLNPTANASVANSKQTDPAFQSRVMLNMLEFFFFSFAHVAVSVTPVLDTRPRPPQQPAFFHGHATPISRPTTPLSQYLQPPQLQSQSQQQSSNLPTSVPSLSLPSLSQPLLRFLNLDDSYYALLKAYLDFFVPLEAPLPVEDPLAQSADLLDASGLRKRFGERAGKFVASATGKPSSGTTSSGPVSVLNSSDLNNVDWNGRVAISKFIVSIFVELWLSQNDYTDAARNGGVSFLTLASMKS